MYQAQPFRSKKKNPLLRGVERLVHAVKCARGPMETPVQRCMARIEAFFIDDGFMSHLFPNRHRLSDKMWRSSQPHESHIAQLAKKGLRTIVNLRGERDCATFYLEEQACRKHGIRLINFPVNSRQPPKRDIIEKLQGLFASIEYPALMHCKAGSDRVGIMSALYLMIAEKKPVEVAMKQLALRFGHIRQSKTGVLDTFLEAFRKSGKKDFLDWALHDYDRDAVIASHKTFNWVEWFYTKILRRE